MEYTLIVKAEELSTIISALSLLSYETRDKILNEEDVESYYYKGMEKSLMQILNLRKKLLKQEAIQLAIENAPEE